MGVLSPGHQRAPWVVGSALLLTPPFRTFPSQGRIHSINLSERPLLLIYEQKLETLRRVCYIFCMTWDARYLARLDELRQPLERTGFTALFEDTATRLWAGNVERFDPDHLHDDESTLGYTAYRNVTNATAVAAEQMGICRAVRDEFGVLTFTVGSTVARIIKTPAESGVRPKFRRDFTWAHRPSRYAAASANSTHRSPSTQESIEPLFEMPTVTDAELANVRNVFLIWGGSVYPVATAGWVGVPTLSPDRWMSVSAIWGETARVATPVSQAPALAREVEESSESFPRPVVTLRGKESKAQ